MCLCDAYDVRMRARIYMHYASARCDVSTHMLQRLAGDACVRMYMYIYACMYMQLAFRFSFLRLTFYSLIDLLIDLRSVLSSSDEI